MRKIIPLLLIVFGIGGGLTAGYFLRPTSAESAELPECKMPDTAETSHGADGVHESHDAPGLPDYVKMNNQFVIPVVAQDRVASMVVLSLSLEITSGKREEVFAREPKLRDMFLQVLFDHANIGGFHGAFTSANNMTALREALLDAARSVMGKDVSDVLITDIARQDVG